MTGLLGRLFAVAEAYPELKANTNFLQLQDQLANIEGELQSARRYYNATVRDLNSSIQSFPAVLVAGPLGFHEEPFYQDDDPSDPERPEGIVRPSGGLTMRALWRALPALASARRFGGGARRRANPALLSATSRSSTTARSRSPRRSTSTSSTIAINHGIYRDFPTRYRGPRTAAQVRVGFTFEGATLDGAAGAREHRALGNGVRIKIGDPDRIVDVGEHRYVIHYRTTRQIGRFKDYDELYWNATGNGWMFPIDVAEARIRLPAAGQRSGSARPTPARRARPASNAEVIDEKPGEIAFRTTQPLGPYEGLTVAAAFPKGVVAEAAAEQPPRVVAAPTMARRHVGLAWSRSACCGFYYVAWQRAGRDPRAGTIVPIFSPPDDLSPAGMRYVTKMGADDRTFAAALVDMGVRGPHPAGRGGRRLAFRQEDADRTPRLVQRRFPHEEEAALRVPVPCPASRS